MNNPLRICQSCGMPLSKDPKRGGTNKNGTKSDKYCGFCFGNGLFTDEGITLQEKIEKNIEMAIRIGIPEEEAKETAESIIPRLERWK